MAIKKRNEINYETADSLFYYKDGELYRKNTNKKIKTKEGKYSLVMVNYKNYLVHRIIFLLHHKYLPNVVDHIDGNKSNNKIENLREATLSQNNYNRKYTKNSSGYKNVVFCKSKNKYMVQLSYEKNYKNYGYFKNLDDAVKLAKSIRENLHGTFARHK
jgi:hypothetical protein